MISIGVIGYGYWGPNIVRNIARHPSLTCRWVCDINPSVLTEVTRIYPEVRVTAHTKDIFNDSAVDAVMIVTPPSTHFKLSSEALASGKHVLVEKPMTTTDNDALSLANAAAKVNKICMVDHTFIYTPAMRMLKELIASGGLGEIYAVDSVRTNLGILQKDSNVIQDLAVHDFSVMDYLFGKKPTEISATGITHSQIRQETVAYISVRYSGSLFMHSHVSWLSPVKIRRMIFSGTKKMLIYDDIEPSEKIKIYDKSVSVVKDPHEYRQLRIGYRNGEVVIPSIPYEEGLWGMISEFERAIRTGSAPLTDAAQGARVVTYISAATDSMRNNGKPVSIK